MDERLRFVARLLEGEKMPSLKRRGTHKPERRPEKWPGISHRPNTSESSALKAKAKAQRTAPRSLQQQVGDLVDRRGGAAVPLMRGVGRAEDVVQPSNTRVVRLPPLWEQRRACDISNARRCAK